MKLFISYRRKSWPFTHRLEEQLKRYIDGEIFIDYTGIKEPDFERSILRHLRESDAVLVVVSDETFAPERIHQDDDWVRREIALALHLAKPIVLAFIEGILLPSPDKLPNDIRDITRMQGIRFYHEYFEAAIKKLAKFIALVTPITSNLTVYPMTPERQALLDIMLDPNHPSLERADTGRKLANLGDPRSGVGLDDDGLPDVEWCEVPAGKFVYQDGEDLSLPTFFIAKYPITYAQFRTFVNASDGYLIKEWWDGLAIQMTEPAEQKWPISNHPSDRVSWYGAVAFSRWLTAKLGYEVQLPTEQEWEKAARSNDGRQYPWGGDNYVSGYANITEKKYEVGTYSLRRTTPVGMYPQGASPYGVLDMIGNLWEWCLNVRDTSKVEMESDARRVLRGGSWHKAISSKSLPSATSRGGITPSERYDRHGFRIVASTVPSS